MKQIQFILSTLCALFFLSCASTEYGSRKYPVKLNTVPANCQAWVFSRSEWLKQKDKLLAPGGKALSDADENLVVTSDEFREVPYVFIFIARDAEQHVLWKEFTPSRDTSVTIDFGPLAQPPAPAHN
jgi:hypothetical protein